MADFLKPEVGGPFALMLAFIGILTKLYFDARKDKRLNVKSGSDQDSAAVQTTKELLATVREQVKSMRADLDEGRERERNMAVQIRRQNDRLEDVMGRLDRADRQIEWLTYENDQLRTQLHIPAGSQRPGGSEPYYAGYPGGERPTDDATGSTGPARPSWSGSGQHRVRDSDEG